MKRLAFFRCNHCGNVVVKLVDSNVPVFCCGEPMEELKANTNDGTQEKHLPVVEEKNGSVKVTVGEVLHPMTDAHFIQFVVVKTNQNVLIKEFLPTDEPTCTFALNSDEKVEKTYVYCNLHSLWAK